MGVDLVGANHRKQRIIQTAHKLCNIVTYPCPKMYCIEVIHANTPCKVPHLINTLLLRSMYSRA